MHSLGSPSINSWVISPSKEDRLAWVLNLGDMYVPHGGFYVTSICKSRTLGSLMVGHGPPDNLQAPSGRGSLIQFMYGRNCLSSRRNVELGIVGEYEAGQWNMHCNGDTNCPGLICLGRFWP